MPYQEPNNELSDEVRDMHRAIESLKEEMDKRVVYDNTGFAAEMTEKYKIQEMIRPKGRQIGWRKK